MYMYTWRELQKYSKRVSQFCKIYNFLHRSYNYYIKIVVNKFKP